MTNERIEATLSQSGARVGQYAVLGPLGNLIRVDNAISGFSAMAFRRTADGWARVC